MYRRILVPLDGSGVAERALPYAALLGRALNLPLLLLRVAQAVGPEQEEARDYLKAKAEELRGQGLAVEAQVESNGVAEGIILTAQRVPDTLVTMATHGHSGLTRWFLGSVTDRVLRACACPLMVVRGNTTAAAGRLNGVVVPLDGSDVSEQALPHASFLAGALSLPVLLVRVIPSSRELEEFLGTTAPPPTVVGYPGLPIIGDPQFFEKVGQQAHEYLAGVRERLLGEGVSAVDQVVLEGHPASALVDLTRDRPNDLVVMTSRGRSTEERWPLGATTDRVVRQAHSPVLVVRP